MWKSVVRPTDFLISFLLWIVAVQSRIALGDTNIPEFSGYVKFGIVMAFATSISFTRSRLYENNQHRSAVGEILATLRASLIAILVFIIFTYFFAPDRLSRGTILIYALLSCFTFIVERLSIRSYLRYARASEKNRSGVILVGNGEPLREYILRANENPELAIDILGWYDAPTWAQETGVTILSSLPENKAQIDTFIVSYTSDQSKHADQFLLENYNDLVKIYVVPDLKSYAFLGLRLLDFSGLPVLALNQPHWSASDLLVKRAIDFAGSLFGLVVLSPILALLAILVKATSAGPIFYGQERMGLDGKTFKMWKFRSMKDGPAQPGWTVENDPRRTKFGSFLRATSCDELPQLWNVLVGDMSLVGPRPEQPYFVENFKKEIPAYMLRHKMKAGITGWAQVNGWRGNTSLHQRIEFDLYYIRNWSNTLDIKILFLTFWKGFINRNAY